MNNKKRLLGLVGLAVSCFVFGFAVSLLSQPGDLRQIKHTPIIRYNQSKIVSIDKGCPIKGKATKTKKIYHLPGDTWYDRLKPTDCFATEEAALKAGFTKAKSFY
jgi:hypothetical protein